MEAQQNLMIALKRLTKAVGMLQLGQYMRNSDNTLNSAYDELADALKLANLTIENFKEPRLTYVNVFEDKHGEYISHRWLKESDAAEEAEERIDEYTGTLVVVDGKDYSTAILEEQEHVRKYGTDAQQVRSYFNATRGC